MLCFFYFAANAGILGRHFRPPEYIRKARYNDGQQQDDRGDKITRANDKMACVSQSAEAIVVMNGCFCPVHAGHLRSLEETKRVVEASGEFRVVAGYFAVAPDKCVKKKVGRIEPWMIQDARLDMCNAVIPESIWSLSAAAFGGWKECGSEMVDRHHFKGTKVFSVPKQAKAHTYEFLTSTAIRAELEEAQSQGSYSETVDSLVERNLLGHAVGERLKQWAFSP